MRSFTFQMDDAQSDRLDSLVGRRNAANAKPRATRTGVVREALDRLLSDELPAPAVATGFTVSHAGGC